MKVEYLSEAKVEDYKWLKKWNKDKLKEIRNKLNTLKRLIQNEITKSTQIEIDGSFKRNLLLIKNNQIDFDYNIVIFTKNKNNELFSQQYQQIRELIKRVFGNEMQSRLQDSKRSLKVVFDQNFSIDISIEYVFNDVVYTLVKDKNQNGKISFIWNKKREYPYKAIAYEMSIKEFNSWELFREIYLEKQIKNIKSKVQKPSFSLYLEALNETYQILFG